MNACEWCWTRASHIAVLGGRSTAELYPDVLAQQEAMGPLADCPGVREKYAPTPPAPGGRTEGGGA